MAGSYAILEETALEGGKTRYKVILKAGDGYQEEQEYIGDEKTLEEAAKHFDAEWGKKIVEDAKVKQAMVTEPEFIEAK